MLKIEKGDPWIMWPNSLVDNFIDEPANRIFDYDGKYNFILEFELTEVIKQKSTLFCKLPSYFGVDIEPNGLTLIYTTEDNKSEYLYLNYNWEINKKYLLKITKIKNLLKYELDGLLLFNTLLDDKLKGDENSHIIFGSGNFPKNGFNLNYMSVILHYLEIIKENVVISKHNFDSYIYNKSLDLTKNCNFIHRICQTN